MSENITVNIDQPTNIEIGFATQSIAVTFPASFVGSFESASYTITASHALNLKTQGTTIHSGSYLGSATTANLTENTNLYYTDARVKTKLNTETVISSSQQLPSGIISSSFTILQNSTILSGSAIKSQMNTDNVISGSMTITSASFASTAQTLLGSVVSSSYALVAQTLLGSVTSASYAVTASYSSNSNVSYQGSTIHSGSFLGSATTNNLTENTNLYYTDARVKTKLNTETVISSSQQLPAGIISSSFGALNGTGVYSSSLQLPSGIISSSYGALKSTGVYSSSFQVFESSTVLSGSDIKITMNTDNVHSGSMLVTSASYASSAQTLLGSVVSASFAVTASRLEGSVTSASYASSASFLIGGSSAISTCKQTAVATSSTFGTLEDCPGMSFSLTSGKTYIFNFNTIWKSAATGTGIGYGFSAPAMTWANYKVELRQAAAGTDSMFVNTHTVLTAALSGSAALAANTEYFGTINGICKPSADGTLQLRCTTEVNASTVSSSYGAGYLIDCG